MLVTFTKAAFSIADSSLSYQTYRLSLPAGALYVLVFYLKLFVLSELAGSLNVSVNCTHDCFPYIGPHGSTKQPCIDPWGNVSAVAVDWLVSSEASEGTWVC